MEKRREGERNKKKDSGKLEWLGESVGNVLRKKDASKIERKGVQGCRC